MACKAVRKAVLSKLSTVTPFRPDDIFRAINWWTLPTIEEALSELVFALAVRTTDDGRFLRRL
jgi:hypothetical protein